MDLPEKFITRMKNIDGFDIDGFLNSYNFPAYSGLRINPSKENSKTLFEKEFSGYDNVPWCENGYYIDKEKISGNHPYHVAGMFYFQEPSAMCAAELLPVDDGDYVLDLCAAPGGKSTQLAAKNNNATLISNEIIPKRAKILSENIERMGFSNVIVTNESPERLEKQFECLGHTELEKYCNEHLKISRTIMWQVVHKTGWKPKFNRHKHLETLEIIRIDRSLSTNRDECSDVG